MRYAYAHLRRKISEGADREVRAAGRAGLGLPQDVRARLGIERTVVVQPSTYGKDNRCTLEAVATIGPNARCIVVVDESVTDAELDRLTKLGARGIRFFMLPGAPLPWEVLETMSARVAPFGWHVQLQLDGRDLPAREAMLKRLTSTLVVDHVGKFLEPYRSIIRASSTAEPGRWRPHLGEAFGALRSLEIRPADLR